MNLLLVGRVDDHEVIEHVFLIDVMRKRLTDREHAVMALRSSGYTRPAVVQILGIGKTTAYTCERQAVKKLQEAYKLEMEGEWKDSDTDASSAENR